MGLIGSHNFGRLLAMAAAVVACLPAVACAQDGAVDLISPETFKLYGDVRAVAVDGEASWTEGGFGKLRYGGDDPARDGNFALKPEFGEGGIVWRPRLGWSLSGTVVALAEGNANSRLNAGLSEAYLTFKPLDAGRFKISARAGLMWPAVSLEHSGPEWAVTDTITPSAIGSWIGEEVKVVGVEVTGKTRLGGHEFAATVAGFDFNDTAGALLAFRGWALDDYKALAFRTQPLPPLNDFIEYVQPRYTHPLLDVNAASFRRPGYYAKLAWTPPLPLRIEAFHYDNRADPQALDASLEWGWRTRFTSVGLVADLGGGRELRAQGLLGHTRMGVATDGENWVDMRFRAAYGMVTQHFAKASLSARVDVFATRNRGNEVGSDDDENGWAATVAAKHELGQSFTAMVEYLHVASDRDARMRAGLAADQTQDQLQMVMRAHW